MTVKDLIDRLCMLDDSKDVVFYNLNNDDLEGRELETILDVDGHVEITVKELKDEDRWYNKSERPRYLWRGH